MPAGVTPPIILNFSGSSVPILQLALSSQTLSEPRLGDLAVNTILPQLVTAQGAALPYRFGGKSRRMQIDFDQHALRSYGLAASDVVNALTVQNLITPVGTEKIGRFEFRDTDLKILVAGAAAPHWSHQSEKHSCTSALYTT
jgi:multidrug efflux pump subunit AcrB